MQKNCSVNLNRIYVIISWKRCIYARHQISSTFSWSLKDTSRIRFKYPRWNSSRCLDAAPVDGHVSQAYFTVCCTILLKSRSFVMRLISTAVQIVVTYWDISDALYILNRTSFSTGESILSTLPREIKFGPFQLIGLDYAHIVVMNSGGYHSFI